MRRRPVLVALLVAVMLAIPAIAHADLAEDILRAFCAGIGRDHPLYDYLGCPALENPSPQG